jgi:replicative DNA helicase
MEQGTEADGRYGRNDLDEVEVDDKFSEVLSYIENNKVRKELGSFNSIPFGLPRFDEVIPGWVKSRYTCITASSGVGKTKLAKFLVLHQTFKLLSNSTVSTFR